MVTALLIEDNIENVNIVIQNFWEKVYIIKILKTKYEISNSINFQLIIANSNNLSNIDLIKLKKKYSFILYKIIIENNKRKIKIVHSPNNLSYINIDDKIYDELEKINYNHIYIGTEYLKESIKFDYLKYNREASNIQKQLYSLVANEYKTSIFNVKNNIIKATNLMYLNCDIIKLKKYFNFDYDYKPTPKIVIKTIVNKI